MEVGIGPGDIVLDGDPAPPPQRGTALNFRPMSVMTKWLVASSCHLVRRYRPRPPPRRHVVLDGTHPPKGGRQQPPLFAHILWLKGSIDQDAILYREARPRRHYVRWGPTSTP